MNPHTPLRLVLGALACALLGPLHVAAQKPTPDTTSAWRYFPLAVGNVWEYLHWSQSVSDPGPELLGYLRWTVEDTTDEGGQRYFVVRKERYGPAGQPLPDSLLLVRFDTLSARLFARDSTGVEGPWPFEFSCPLDAPFYATLECEPWQAETGGGYEESVEIGGDVISTPEKEFIVHDENYSYHVWHIFAANIGLIYRIWYLGNVYWETYGLQYVRVGGVEYGEPTGVAVEPDAPTEPAGLALTVWPNPSRASAEVRFSLPEAAAVRLAVYDLLGRKVARLVDGPMPAGTHHVRLDGAALPAGVYLVRLLAGEEAGLVRVTRLR